MAMTIAVNAEDIPDFAEGIYALYVDNNLTDEAVSKTLGHLWHSPVSELTNVTQAMLFVDRCLKSSKPPKGVASWWRPFTTERRLYISTNATLRRHRGDSGLIPTIQEFRERYPHHAAPRVGKPGRVSSSVAADESPAEPLPLPAPKPAPQMKKSDTVLHSPIPDSGSASGHMALHMAPTTRDVISALHVLIAAGIDFGAGPLNPSQAFEIVTKYADIEEG